MPSSSNPGLRFSSSCNLSAAARYFTFLSYSDESEAYSSAAFAASAFCLSTPAERAAFCASSSASFSLVSFSYTLRLPDTVAKAVSAALSLAESLALSVLPYF